VSASLEGVGGSLAGSAVSAGSAKLWESVVVSATDAIDAAGAATNSAGTATGSAIDGVGSALGIDTAGSTIDTGGVAATNTAAVVAVAVGAASAHGDAGSDPV
jgi:hypothetical protein